MCVVCLCTHGLDLSWPSFILYSTNLYTITNRFSLVSDTKIRRAMRDATKDVSTEEWEEWILMAIRKIRSQKQRPSLQRICQAIGTHHKFHEEQVATKLEEAVASGAVLKTYSKGLHSYKVPQSRRRIVLKSQSNLSKLVANAVRDLGEYDGSSLKSIESFLHNTNIIELEPDADFKVLIKNAVQIAIEKEYLVMAGKNYKLGGISVTALARRRHTDGAKSKRATVENEEQQLEANVSDFCVVVIITI